MKTQKSLIRPLTLIAVMLLLLLVSHISFAQTSPKVKNVVIVHGVFVDVSGCKTTWKNKPSFSYRGNCSGLFHTFFALTASIA